MNKYQIDPVSQRIINERADAWINEENDKSDTSAYSDADVRELVAAYLDCAQSEHGLFHDDPFDRCGFEFCVDARALLAKFEVSQ